jgi:anaerobic selenocysteine-containing dehydrogenase
MRTQSTFCRICEPMCPLIAELDDNGRAMRLSPDLAHPSGGKACHKGLAFLDVHRDPDRVNWPLKRSNPRSDPRGDFDRLDWDVALKEIAETLNRVRAEFGNNSVAIYTGNPFAMSSSAGLMAIEPFRAALDTRMNFSSNTQDTNNKVVGAALIYGSPSAMMVPDLANTEYLLCLGGNPRVSRWTLMSTPNDDLEILKAVRRKGGKVRFVNPRRTESSTDETGPTLLIKPGTDVYLLAALLNEIERRGGFDEALLAKQAGHVDGLRQFAARYPPDAVADVVGITADAIRTVAGEIIQARAAAVYMATGVNQSRQGLLAYWLAEMINLVTGNLGRAGGMHKPAGLADDFPAMDGMISIPTSAGSIDAPNVTGFPVLLPSALLPTLIENGDIRALLVLGGNPLLTVGGEASMRAALAKLDLVVSIDIYRQATAEISDFILPSTDWLEHSDINLIVSGLQQVPYVQYTDPVVPVIGERKNPWWILRELTNVMGLSSGSGVQPDPEDGDTMLAGLLGLRGLSVDQMRDLPSNTKLIEPLPPESVFERCVKHSGGKVDCCPELFEQHGLFDRCDQIFEELKREPAAQLKLISLRTRYMHNSWLANMGKLRRGRNATNPLHITEADAAVHGLHDGDLVSVSNPQGSIEAQVFIDNDLREGVVAMTHGYGHSRSFGLGVANRKADANCNVVMPMGEGQFEPLSGMSWISAVPVAIERLAGR